ncbi:5,10-methenyltetrahydrofolate synthetase, partial [Cladochytrium tenue]
MPADAPGVVSSSSVFVPESSERCGVGAVDCLEPAGTVFSFRCEAGALSTVLSNVRVVGNQTVAYGSRSRDPSKKPMPNPRHPDSTNGATSATALSIAVARNTPAAPPPGPLAAGRLPRVYVPVCESRDRMSMLRLYSVADLLENAPPNKMGIREPGPRRPSDLGDGDRERALVAGGAENDGGLDVVVMPGLAFDRDGWRIGYGRGYYDRFLRECAAFNAGLPPAAAAPRRTVTLAVALREQLLPAGQLVPRGDLDERPDSLLIPPPLQG